MSIFKGLVSVLLLTVSTLFWAVPLYALTLAKLVTPTRRWRLRVLGGLNRIALAWIGTNLWWMRRWLRPVLDIHLPEGLSPHQWWLVIANHRSWTDIFLLQMALHRRIPMPRFFLKRELIWVPVIGLAWWALEFPFMRRYKREALARNPALARRDREATQRLCDQARQTPMAIYNFVEGTRFTPAKQREQASPYRHLLRPKAGGSAQVIGLLGRQLSGILDVTLAYARECPNFWDFLCGREGPVSLQARRIAVPEWMLEGDYHQDPEYKERFQQWLNALWQEKDRRLASATGSAATVSAR
ncbi:MULTISPECIES: acyltransferase [unclassified Modicisalibacter]|uniref:acyltransferase n=1 Tax=unclassified Modicisalibacter TaxID=2679913 RepID=UPI001CC91A32|nr:MULTISPECIES: acyltransferase [unclassified Modicisalibacter]MBZ9556877.1 acyltransferase [Modicisalibacter sp. R2A 31.J]MBZ9574462.1 acyltransferase [Modicisalibacter sp. MOD 31.J]